jgi:5-methylcytosine-specific restriction enzyme subunit McrC
MVSFCEAVDRLLQDGLLRRHIELEENLRVLRGRLVFSSQISKNLILQDRLYCRFAQPEVDIAENQVILWTLLLAQRCGEWSVDVKQALQSHILHFGGVSVRQFVPQLFPDFTYDRLSFRYEEVHSWCKLFIDLMGLSDKPGDRLFNGYCLDMNLLFERFVAATFQKAASSVPTTRIEYHEDSAHRYYLDIERRIRIVPDLILRGTNGATIVADAKYKRTVGDGRGKNPDLYQMVAYCTAMELVGEQTDRPQGILVYPRSEWDIDMPNKLHVVTHQGSQSKLTLQVVLVDLNSANLIEETRTSFVGLLRDL